MKPTTANLRLAVGVGVRWQLPFLGNALLSVNLAFPVMKQSSDQTQPVSFSFGARSAF